MEKVDTRLHVLIVLKEGDSFAIHTLPVVCKIPYFYPAAHIVEFRKQHRLVLGPRFATPDEARELYRVFEAATHDLKQVSLEPIE